MDMTITFPGGKRVDAAYDGFLISTDQPTDEGGQDTAPSPLLYCLASLGTCAGYYVLSYLQARGLPTDGVKLLQSHEADEKTGKLKKFGITIQVPPEIPEKHHKPLARSAEKCTVKKLMEDRPVFEIRTETAGG